MATPIYLALASAYHGVIRLLQGGGVYTSADKRLDPVARRRGAICGLLMSSPRVTYRFMSGRNRIVCFHMKEDRREASPFLSLLLLRQDGPFVE